MSWAIRNLSRTYLRIRDHGMRGYEYTDIDFVASDHVRCTLSTVLLISFRLTVMNFSKILEGRYDD